MMNFMEYRVLGIGVEVFWFADRPGLSDPKMVEELQEKVIEAIKLQLS